MPPNVYIVGAQCTGKTTIINALQTRLASTTTTLSPPSFIRETARGILAEHSFSSADIRNPDRCIALQRLILSAQAAAEAAALQAGDWFVSDRSGVDAIVYARIYAGRAAADEMLRMDEWRAMRERLTRGVVIVCEAGTRWLTDDGVRLMPTDRGEWMSVHDLFCRTLEDLGVAYVVLPAELGDVESRVSFVIEQIFRGLGKASL